MYCDPYNIDWNSQHGWICSKCGRSFAPYISECQYCNSGRRTFATSSSTGMDISWIEDYLKKQNTGYSNNSKTETRVSICKE